MVTMQRYFTYIVNTVFVMTGIYSTVTGSLYFSFYYLLKTFLERVVWLIPLLLLVVGICIVLLGVFGCFGVPLRHRAVAFVFYPLSVLLVFAEAGIGVFWAMMWSHFAYYIHMPFDRRFAITNTTYNYERIKVHFLLNCCGVNGPSDYLNSTGELPMDCCPVLMNHETSNFYIDPNATCTEELATPSGCEGIMLAKIKSHAYVIIISSIMSGCIKILVLLFSLMITFNRMLGPKAEPPKVIEVYEEPEPTSEPTPEPASSFDRFLKQVGFA